MEGEGVTATAKVFIEAAANRYWDKEPGIRTLA